MSDLFTRPLSEIPENNSPGDNDVLLGATEGGEFQKTALGYFTDMISSAYLGIASTSTTPPATGSWWYDATAAGTYTNFIKADTNPVVLTATDFEDAGVFYDVKIIVTDNVAVVQKREIIEGKSAYEVAVANGFVGTEAEWLASLQADLTFPVNHQIGNHTTLQASTATNGYLFVPNQPIGFNGLLSKVTFGQTIYRAAATKIAILEKTGDTIEIVEVHIVNVVADQQYIDLSSLGINVTEDQYFGIQAITTAGTPTQYLYKVGAGGSVKPYLFAAASIVVGANTSTLGANFNVFDYSFEVIETKTFESKINDIDAEISTFQSQIADLAGVNPFQGKNIDTNGDSITWYDEKAYTVNHSEAPNIAVGYQSHLRSILGCTTTNNGLSGQTLPQIRTALVGRNYSAVDFVTITGGVNDWGYDVAIGAIQPTIGGALNTATSYGALQSMIEHILTQNPEARIFLIAPIRGYVPGDGEFPETYPDMFKAVGKLYGIPVCDWYNELSFNPLTYNYFYKDIGSLAGNKIHVGDDGYKRMGEYLASWMLSNV